MSAKRDASRSGLHHFDVGDGQHPTAIIALRVVENVQLPRMQSAHVGLVAQRPVDGVGERLALVQEGPGKGPTRAGRPAYLQHHQPEIGIQSQHRGVHGDRWPRVVGEAAAAAVSVRFASFMSEP